MKNKLRIYVAGPYTPENSDGHDAVRIAHKNVQNAIKTGIKLIEKGHIPFIPHLMHFVHLETIKPLSKDFYYNYDMEWLKYCNALIYIGPSNGADAEMKWAEKHGLKIFRKAEEVPECK